MTTRLGADREYQLRELGPGAARILRWLPTAVLMLIVVAWLLPTVGALIASLRPGAFETGTPWWNDLLNPETWTIEAYRIALDDSGINTFADSMVNSFAIAIPATAIPLLLGSAAAYALVWMPIRHKDVMLFAVVALIAVPIYGVLIPILQAFSFGVHLTLPILDKTVTLIPEVGLAGTIPGTWIVHVGAHLPFSIFLLTFAIARVPTSLIDSARLDGASDSAIFWRVVVPLSRPALASLGVLLFLWSWNDFIVALTIIGANAESLPATVRFSSIGTFVSGPVTLAQVFIHASIAVAVFYLFQKSFVRGMLTGAE